jgi:NADH:ubiquinone oxidoreductase subunit 2 (subunit N)
MSDTVHSIAWLVPLLPLAAAGWCAVALAAGWQRGEEGEGGIARLSLLTSGAALALLLLLDLLALAGEPRGLLDYGEWFAAGSWSFGISLLVDRLALIVATVASLMSLATLRFSVDYMHREEGFVRFFLGLNLIHGALLLVILSGNALLTFIGWELAGLSSYLLIGYLQQSRVATANATRVLVTNRIGDAGFLLGIALSLWWLDGVGWAQINQAVMSYDTLTGALIAAGFLLAAAVKSAQVPFSPWIARALEGPTPSSALFYGSVMVHLGVYLLIRLEPLISQIPLLMVLIAAIGLLTALYGWLGALVQTDIKGSLQSATVAQTGLMFLWCGLGWFELATGHLVAHALVRGWHYLHAPSLLAWSRAPLPPLPQWLSRRHRLRLAARERFWLDPLADALLVRPTEAIANEVEQFDEKVVDRIVGLPGPVGAVTTDSRRASGVAGRLLEAVAHQLDWFEQQLVLRGGGEGLLQLIQHVGRYLTRIDQFLGQPRYLLLMIMATFVVIL